METRTGNRVKVPFYKRSKFQDGVFIATLVAVPLISFCVFWLYVNLDTVAMTFQRYNVRTGEYEWYGFERYIEVFRTYVFGLDGAVAEHNAFLNTFRAILINIIIFPLAYISAYAFYKKIPCEKFFRVCFYIPSIISITVLTLLYRYMFHPDFRTREYGVPTNGFEYRLAGRKQRCKVDAHLYIQCLGGVRR